MTKLIIEITGGFAYVPEVSSRTLNIAYLNDVEIKETVAGVERIICQVDEIGTELSVLRGNIVDPPLSQVPPNRTFNLDKAVVKIPALNTINTALIYNRPAFPPSPAKPTNANHWKNLQYVPSLKDHHPNSGIRPTWRNEVNGRVELRGGTLEATVPTDPSIREGAISSSRRARRRGAVLRRPTRPSIRSTCRKCCGVAGHRLGILRRHGQNRTTESGHSRSG